MPPARLRALGFAVAVHVGRFAVIIVALAIAPLIGISGWYLGLFANVACVLYAVVLVTVRRVLERLRSAFGPLSTVALTAALFGLQHLSAFATTSRDGIDIAGNVVVSACYGFALAAFQYRYRWVMPLILLHAAADFTSVLSQRPLGDLVVIGTVVGFVALGFLALGGLLRRPEPGVSPPPS